MKILFVINSLELGGAETFLLRLINELREKYGVKPFLYEVNPHSNNIAFRENFISSSQAVILPNFEEKEGFLDFLGWKMNALFFKLFKKSIYLNWKENKKKNYFNNFIKKNKIDLINSHLVGSDLFVANYLKPLSNLPWVATSQGCYNDITDVEVAKVISEQADGLTYVADKNLELFRQFSIDVPSNKKLIYNSMKAPKSLSLQTKAEIGIQEDAILIIHVSRSIPEKGMKESIEAVMKAKEDGCSELHLALVGPENDYYKNLKSTYSSNDYIHFLGEQLNPIEWVKIADIGILPSYFPGESCPSTIIEYLACKLPVVSTRIGEIPIMIEHKGKSGGILIPLNENGKPSVDSLSKALHELYSNPDLRKDLGSTAFQAFAKFDIGIAATEYIKIFETALANS